MPGRSINNPSYQAMVGARTFLGRKDDDEFGLNFAQEPHDGPTTPPPPTGNVPVGKPRVVRRTKPQKGGNLPFPM